MNTIRYAGTLATVSLALLGAACNPNGTSTADEAIKQTAQELSRHDLEDHGGDGTIRGPVSRIAPVKLADISREPTLFRDYSRYSFISDPTIVPDTLNRGNAKRAFMTASFFFHPPLPVSDAVRYVGLQDEPGQNFAAYRCKPDEGAELIALAPLLATWVNVFDIIEQDFATTYSCPANNAIAENQLLCIAERYQDEPRLNVTIGLDRIFDVAVRAVANPATAQALDTYYGISPAFSGLGYAIKDSFHADLTTEEALRNAIAPEYLVRNVRFAEGNCRCILVPPYPGRSEDPIDPDFVWKEGSSGRCAVVDRLRPAHGRDLYMSTKPRSFSMAPSLLRHEP